MDSRLPCAEIRQLVADHHQAVYRYAYRLCGNHATAEDLTQQVFLNAHRRIEQLREPAAARGWLFAILRRAAQRIAQRDGLVSESLLEVPLAELAIELPSDSPVDEQRLQLALNQLPVDYKHVILLYYFEDCSYKEIAQRLEIPLGTVMSRLARAKRQLRRIISAVEEADAVRRG